MHLPFWLTSVIIYVKYKYVHGSHFHELVLRSVQPEDLLATLSDGETLNPEGGAVVGPHLLVAAPSRPRPGVRGVGEEGDGAFGSLEIVADRAEDCVEQGGVGLGDSQGTLKWWCCMSIFFCNANCAKWIVLIIQKWSRVLRYLRLKKRLYLRLCAGFTIFFKSSASCIV